jgi:uncharacterized membrane protein YadS
VQLGGKRRFYIYSQSIFCTLILGPFIGKWLKIDKKTSHLISCGTAICHRQYQSKSDEKQTSVVLGVILF